ncbi:MAG: hypothetical protein PHY42_01865 [Bacilli bacterium]|nr:hypothetical protein [Bacilli bacterium]
MKQKSLLIVILMLILSIGLIGCSQSESQSFKVSDAYITLDINPSIEIITDEEGLVAQVNALNEDAQVMLEGTNYVGQTVDVVVEALIELATELGYIEFNVDNAILISATAENEEDVKDIEDKITEKVQKFVEERSIRVNLIKTQFEDKAEILALAETLGISAGKVKLITYAMAFDETLTYENGATMSVRDLNRIVIQSRNEAREFMGEEVQSAYAELKQEQRLSFIQGRVTLLNTAIQNADSALFTELLLETTATVEAVKALYQQYYEALMAVTIPEEEPVVEPEDPLEPEVDVGEQITVLEEARTTLRAQMKASIEQLLDTTLTLEERNAIIAEFETARNQYREYGEQLEALKRQERNQYGVGIGGFFKDGMRNEVMSQFGEIRESFEEQFTALGISLEELEELFINDLKDELDALRAEYKDQVTALKAEMKDQIDAVKAQLQQERNLLRDAYGQNRYGKTDEENPNGNRKG